jgi:hypothetical protein
MEIAGQSVIKTTLNVYSRVNLDTRRAPLNQLDDELSG